MQNDVWRFLLIVSPVASLALGGLLLMFISGIGSARRSTSYSIYFLSAVSTVLFSLSLLRNGQLISGLPEATWYAQFLKHFFADNFTYGWLTVLGFFLIGGGLLTLSSPDSQETVPDRLSLLLFSGCGIGVLLSGSSLLMTFLGMEFLSLPVYALVGSRARSIASCEAALKYFLFGSLASVLLLLAIALLYSGAGSLYFFEVERYLASAPLLVVALAVGLTIAVMGFKLGIVPFNQWLPDAYEGAPSAVTGFMGSAVKLAGIVLALRVFWGPLLPAVERWSPLLVCLAIATMIAGSLGGLLQSDLKRLLAYSSIAHAGYLLLGIAVAPSHLDTVVIWFYIISYGGMFIAIFGVIAEVERLTGSSSIDSLTGLGFKRPLLFGCLSLLTLSAAGIPPLAGFSAKYLVLLQVARTGNMIPITIALVTSAIAVVYYLRVLVTLYMKEPALEGANIGSESRIVLALTVVAAIALVALGVMPDWLLG